MTQIDSWVEGKKVLILGFGREGQSTYQMLTRSSAYKELAIADKEEGKSPSPAVPWISGADYQHAIDRYDVVFKSPGIVLERPREEYTCEILSQTEVFFHLFRDQIIGITGTKGKSTTTSLLYHILKSAGRKVQIAGNIGIPAFDHMDELDDESEIVFELSCHQLEYMTVSPHIALLLNIHEEHLDHYGTMENYVRAKEQIYRNQYPKDILICSHQCLPKKDSCPSRLIPVLDLDEQGQEDNFMNKEAVLLSGSCISWKGKSYQIPEEQIHLLGHHNYFDIALVYSVCQLKGISDQEFSQGLITYQPLPHRLYFLGEKKGVKYYDDSISTICDTTIQALNTLSDTDTVLIGGMDRGIDYQKLIAYLSDSPVSWIILMEATGKRIYQEIQERFSDFKQPQRLILVEHLEEAVKKAKQLTRPGKSCVLSPAAASYGIFKNFEERGDKFWKLVREDNF